MLDQAGVDTYMASFYKRLSPTWRKRLKVVGIHNYSDVNRSRSTGTSKIIKTARKYNRSTKFWFTETGALAGFNKAFPFSLTRQASRIKNMFTYATRYRSLGVERVYSYNWVGAETGGCGTHCQFDAGLVNPNGTIRPVYNVFKSKLAGFSRWARVGRRRGAGRQPAGASSSGSSAPRPEISSTRSIWRDPRQMTA